MAIMDLCYSEWSICGEDLGTVRFNRSSIVLYIEERLPVLILLIVVFPEEVDSCTVKGSSLWSLIYNQL